MEGLRTKARQATDVTYGDTGLASGTDEMADSLAIPALSVAELLQLGPQSKKFVLDLSALG
jgi:hypothetical protein